VRGRFQLTDFGIACLAAGNHQTAIGTPGFAAPEVLNALNLVCFDALQSH